MERLLGLGRQDVTNQSETFCMTVLALKLASGANGVSKLHGEVARDMWKAVWPGLSINEVPITSITNGIHTRTWISHDLADLYDRYLGPGWINSPDDQSIWSRVDDIPDTELWRTHERRRERLVDFARKRLYLQYKNRGAPASALQTCLEVLDPEALTIGFARRFATYKRATLLLHDRARLKRILLNRDRPVQIIIAGKAHPADQAGKQLIRELVHFGLDPEVRKHIIFVEDYDMNVARYLVQGVDCWLNTPRRPMEASGTSGMKAAANGALNISIPDGWWCEAEDLGKNGWSIGKGEDYESLEEQDAVESEALYEILEHEVVPMYYDRGQDNLPREWISCMKDAIRTIGPVFNTYRMVQEYSDRFYLPCSLRRNTLFTDKRARALALSEWKQRVNAAWGEVRIDKVECGPRQDLPVGTQLEVTAYCQLGSLSKEDVTAEIFYGPLDPKGKIPLGSTHEMSCISEGDKGVTFRGAVECTQTGQLGLAVRLIPNHVDLGQKHEMALVAWA
jgi:starch phosphorylase